MSVKNQHFWNMDVRVLLRMWLEGVWTLSQVFILFGIMALPILIPWLILWMMKTMMGIP